MNGQWAGTLRLRDATEEAALDSCPRLWEFLDQKGNEGWDLVTATSEIAKGEVSGIFSDQLELTRMTTLFLKRAVTG